MFKSILWFRQDLRLHDNEALLEAIRSSDEILPVFIFNPEDFRLKTQYGTPKTGEIRTRFILECVEDLRKSLRSLGSDLIVRVGDPAEILYQLTSHYKINWIYCNRERTREEVNVQDTLENKLWTIGSEVRYSRGKMLFYTADLPYPVTHCPDTFTLFKKETEQFIQVRTPLESPDSIPPLPEQIESGAIPAAEDLITTESIPHKFVFSGGETAGLSALSAYETDPKPAFMMFDNAYFSPWLSTGCLSPKKVYFAARNFQSGEEIRQYLLYRDYLRLMGKKYGDRIFYKTGIKKTSIQTIPDLDSLKAWQQGRLGIDIIDAAMQQLNQTGWLPEYLRRVSSSYFLKVLNLDWRLGAAYFESRLIDYDPCSNWVAWLNAAGVGPEIRDDRMINYDAVGKRFDTDGFYLESWKT